MVNAHGNPQDEVTAWLDARRRVEGAWYQVRSRPAMQRLWNTIQAQGVPIVRTLTCPVDVPRLRAFAASPEGQQLWVREDGSVRNVTGAHIIESFLRSPGLVAQPDGSARVELKYHQHQRKVADSLAAGFIEDSRLLTSGTDPFKLPSRLRGVALARYGWDFDDSASFPRALTLLTDVGCVMAEFLVDPNNRKPLLHASGAYFFAGAGLSDAVHYTRMKKLVNLLDMDGTYASWRRTFASDLARGAILANAQITFTDRQGQPQQFDWAVYISQQVERTEDVWYSMPRFAGEGSTVNGATRRVQITVSDSCSLHSLLHTQTH